VLRCTPTAVLSFSRFLLWSNPGETRFFSETRRNVSTLFFIFGPEAMVTIRLGRPYEQNRFTHANSETSRKRYAAKAECALLRHCGPAADIRACGDPFAIAFGKNRSPKKQGTRELPREFLINFRNCFNFLTYPLWRRARMWGRPRPRCHSRRRRGRRRW
jgi:hypothetical protein